MNTNKQIFPSQSVATTAPATSPIISVHNVYKKFGTLEVIKGIDLEIHPHEIVSIVGPSGAGKTTLLQIMGTLMRPDAGTVLIEGDDVLQLSATKLAHFRCMHLGFVFQFHQLLPEFSAIENVLIPAMIARLPVRASKKRALELLDFLGLANRTTHKPSELSGGEKQRVAIARALMNKPSVILADEPSGSLDSRNKEELHSLFFRLREEMGQTFVIVTHDEALAYSTDRTIHLLDGRVNQNEENTETNL